MRPFLWALGMPLFCLPITAFAHDFVTETVDADVAVSFDNTDTAIDSQGGVATCYYDTEHDVLKYAYDGGEGFIAEIADGAVGEGNDFGTPCSLAFDAQDRPHILHYYATTRELWHSRKQGGAWIHALVDGDARPDPFGSSRLSAAFSPDGILGVAYFDDAADDLRYAKFDGAAWQGGSVMTEGDVGRYPALAFDPAGRPAIAYVEVAEANSQVVRFVRHDGAGWLEPETVDDEDGARFYYVAMGFDAGGVAHVAYQADTAVGLQIARYAALRDGAWREPLDVESGSQGGDRYLDLAVGPDGDVHVAFNDNFFSALFGQFRHLKLVSLYFTDEEDERVHMAVQSLAFSAIGNSFKAVSVAVDGNFNLAVSWTAREWGGDDRLRSARLTDWTPAVRLDAPREGFNAGAEAFVFSWRVFDPDGDAEVDLSYRDFDFQLVAFSDVYDAADGGAEADLSGIEPGEYVVRARVSDDGFETYGASWSAVPLVVEAPVVAAEIDVDEPDADNGPGGDVDADAEEADDFDGVMDGGIDEDLDGDSVGIQAGNSDDSFEGIPGEESVESDEDLLEELADGNIGDDTGGDEQNIFDESGEGAATDNPGGTNALENEADEALAALAACSLNLDPRDGDPAVLILYALLLLPLLELRIRRK